MRRWRSLEGERGGYPVLILAQLVREFGPVTGNGFVLEQGYSQGRQHYKSARQKPGSKAKALTPQIERYGGEKEDRFIGPAQNMHSHANTEQSPVPPGKRAEYKTA